MLKCLKKLLSGEQKTAEAVQKNRNEYQEKANGSNLNTWYTYGAREKETATVVFTNQSRGIRKTIVDNGKICNFPGIEGQEQFEKELGEGRLAPQICYRTDFSKRDDGRILMIWEVQPDGMYWADEDGFGAENDLEIRLYSYIDENGNFMHPFRLYSLGSKKYFETFDA